MASQLTALITLVSTSGVLALFLCLYGWMKRREISHSRTFIVYTGALVIYNFAYAFQLAADSIEAILRWTIVEYVGMAASPVLGFMFIMQYVGKRLSSRSVAAMMVIPVITVLIVATNDVHHLFYKSVYQRQDVPFLSVDMEIGQWYIVHGIYSFSSMLASLILLLRRWSSTSRTYRKHLATLILGQLLPILAAFIYLLGLIPYGIDPVPLVLCFTSAMYIWAILSTKMLTIVPIAKETIFESMSEGVIVLDATGRIIDLNNAMSRLIPGLESRCIGMTWDDAWFRITGNVFPVGSLPHNHQGEVRWTVHGQEAFYSIRSSVIHGPGGDVRGSVWMVIDVTRQRKLQEQLKQMAYYDGLTGIYNRSQFIVRSKQRIEEAQLHSQPLSFVLFDVDHFKRINDTYGHEAGDQALVHVTSVVRQRLPEGVLFGRFGGEEFALALPGRSLRQAAELSETIRAGLEAELLHMDHGTIALTITASFGVAECEQNEAFESVLRRADRALYMAKHDGRNRVTCCTRMEEAEPA